MLKIKSMKEKAKIYTWKCVAFELEGKNWEYASIFKWEFNSIWWTVSVAVDKKWNIVLIKNYRHGIDDLSYEMVRWGLEAKLTVEENALKEFKEETWITEKPIEIKKLAKLNQDTWVLWNYISYVLLEFDDLTKFDVYGKKDGSYEEIYEVKLVSLNEFENMIKNGDIVDACTISAYWLLKAFGKI